MSDIPSIFWLIPLASVAALVMAWTFFSRMMREEEGTPRMCEIAGYVRRGAMAYLKQQYKVVLIVFIVLAIIFAIMAYGFHVQNPWVPFAFLTGGFFSGLAGFFGMKTATYASGRTANAARQGLDKGLKIAFRSGAVMGLVVVGLGLLDIAVWFLILHAFYSGGEAALITVTTTMLTFGMGASTQALFARVGGGIYTKAADVGADLVGKVEADIPEDDPRNPATIADNVGDNVGDVAGMGADLYESYCGSILSTAALGAGFCRHRRRDATQGCHRPDAHCCRWRVPQFSGYLHGANKRRSYDEGTPSLPRPWHEHVGYPHRSGYLCHPLSLGIGQLARHLVQCRHGLGSRRHHRTEHGVLHLAELQADERHC